MNFERTKDKKKEYTVLLATKSQAYRNNLASTLRMQGYKVELAQGGFHLLHMLENSPEFEIDLIIIHEDMDDMSAYEVVSLIRVNKSKSELPIVYISRHNEEEIVSEMLSVDTNDFIVQTPAFSPILSAAKKYCC